MFAEHHFSNDKSLPAATSLASTVDEFANRTGKGDGDASCVVLSNVEVFLLFLFLLLLIFIICSDYEELAAWTTNRA
jgi:hypothetical protein